MNQDKRNPEVDNARVAQALSEMASLLEAQEDNPFRVAAYRRAGETVMRLERSLRELHRRGGAAALDRLPGIGPRITAAIVELLDTGQWQQLERLRGSADPQALFRTIPGVGPDLAKRLHEEIGVDSLEALESAARAGRLETVDGIGPRRAAAIGAALTHMLDESRSRRRATHHRGDREPPVELLLQVDEEYRSRAEAGKLPTIAPKRFNPTGVAWLPVLHTEHSGWHFTALYSNTARAHELDRTHDWVVIHAEDDAHREHPYTVVTEGRGVLAGRRVVRGREVECKQAFERLTS
ncbi:MAG: helix-hairpin-helix domain-containing protein [Hydrogenophaga sp.]|nr:helix-hairpin-helix domain-containing protein [Hydrogenophaga sp.]